MEDIVTQAMTLLMEGQAEDAVKQLLTGYQEHCASLDVSQQDIDNSLQSQDQVSFQVPAISLKDVVDIEMEYVSNGTEFRLFNGAFVVEGAPRSSPLTKVVLSAVIMYNIGVIFHLFGAFPCDEADLSKAYFMYSKAAETLQRYHLEGSHLEEFEMALYCNMGHVHSYMLNEKGMNSCRREIRKRLERIDSRHNMDPGTVQFFQDMLGVPQGSFDRAPAA